MDELTAYLAQLRRRGYQVRLSKSGHWHIRDERGHLVAVTSGTPGDRRSLLNFRATLRRAERRPAPRRGELIVRANSAPLRPSTDHANGEP